MKSISKLLVRDLKDELKKRNISFAESEKKQDLLQVSLDNVLCSKVFVAVRGSVQQYCSLFFILVFHFVLSMCYFAFLKSYFVCVLD